MHAHALKADLLLLLTAVIWGCAFVAQRAGMDHVGPHTFNAVRFALGALVLLPVAWRSTRYTLAAESLTPRPTRGTYLLWGGVAGSILFMGAALQQVGLIYTTAGNAGFITGLYVVLVPIMARAMGNRQGLGIWLGALLAVIGLYLLSIDENFRMAYGDLLQLCGAFFWAGHVLLIGWVSPRVNPLLLAWTQYVACALLSLCAALATEDISWAGIQAGAWPILYGGVVSVGIAYTLQVVAQRDAPPAHAAILLSMEALFAALAGWLLLDESMSGRGMVGCALMLVAMLTAQLAPMLGSRHRRGTA